MKNTIRAFCFILSALLLLTACSSVVPDSSIDSEKPSQTPEVTAPAAPSFDNDDLFSQKSEDGVIIFDGDAKISGDGLSAEGSVVTVSAEGVFRVNGSSSDGQIIIDCSDKDDVTLIFDNLTLHCEDGPAVWCLEADTLTISIPEGSTSALSDGASRSDDSKPDAAVFSKGDLYFNGKGSLSVAGNINNAIESKDSLTVLECSLSVSAVDDGIIGKDSVEIGANANVTVDSDGDGIRSTNTEDEGRGNIYIGSCTVSVHCGADAVQAAVSLTVDVDSTINIVSGGGAENGTSGNSSGFDGGHGRMDPWGWGNESTSEDNTSSMKGLKASSAIFINGGTVNASCADDAVHCNGDIFVEDGILLLASGDDGIHADSELTVSGGEITISESYEGMEANVITVSGGRTSITAVDDGINVAGGNDTSSAGGGLGNDIFAEDDSCLLSVSGGYICVNASGDGVDSNGSVKMSGGELYVSGPTNSGNGFLDYNGDFEITGGTLLAVGSSGMAQTTNAGTQASVCATVNGTVSSGSVITFKTSDGKEIISYTAPKDYQCFVASSPLMTEGNKIQVYIDGELLGSLTASVRISSGSAMGGPGGHGGGPGGGHGRP